MRSWDRPGKGGRWVVGGSGGVAGKVWRFGFAGVEVGFAEGRRNLTMRRSKEGLAGAGGCLVLDGGLGIRLGD